MHSISAGKTRGPTFGVFVIYLCIFKGKVMFLLVCKYLYIVSRLEGCLKGIKTRLQVEL